MVRVETKQEVYARMKKSLGNVLSEKDLRKFAEVAYNSQRYEAFQDFQRVSTITNEEIDQYLIDSSKPSLFFPDYIMLRGEIEKQLNYNECKLLNDVQHVYSIERKEKKSRWDIIEIDDSVKHIGFLLGVFQKSDWIYIHPYIKELAKGYYEKYNPHKHAGRKSNVEGRFIRMVNADTNETIDRFSTREAVINYCGISKGNLSKCLKSVSDNQTEQSKWKSFKFEGVKYYFIPC